MSFFYDDKTAFIKHIITNFTFEGLQIFALNNFPIFKIPYSLLIVKLLLQTGHPRYRLNKFGKKTVDYIVVITSRSCYRMRLDNGIFYFIYTANQRPIEEFEEIMLK